MRHVHILCIASEHIYTEVIDAFRSYFYGKGWKVTYEYAFKRQPKAYSYDTNIVIKAQRNFNPDELPRSSCKILFQSEQFSKLKQFDSMPYVENWDLILDVFKDNVDMMRYNAIPIIKFFPIGYDKAYDMQSENGFLKDKDCNLDCYFFGARTKHRVDMWNQYVKPVAPNSRLANTDIGLIKYQNIICAKINLFLSAWEPYFVPTMHIMQILANRKFLIVVAETPQDFHPYANNRNFMVVQPFALGEVIKTALLNPDFRKAMAETMWQDITKNHLFTDYLDQALEGLV